MKSNFLSARLASYLLLIPVVAQFSFTAPTAKEKEDWINLFNGKDIKNWTVKIHHHETGDNYGETFRVEDGIIKVRYDKYDKFNERYGHLYFNTPYSY